MDMQVCFIFSLIMPFHDNSRGIKCYPCPPVRMSVHTYLNVCPYIRHTQRQTLAEIKSFDQNFMKLGHIVKYNDVFFKFDNGLYRTMSSRVIAFCL